MLSIEEILKIVYSCHLCNAQFSSKTSILIILYLDTSSDRQLIISEFNGYTNLWAFKNALMALLMWLFMVQSL